MKIVVLSDSHGNFFSLQAVVEENPSADLYLFLGDGERDFEDLHDLYPMKSMLAVRGNCDYYSELPDSRTFTLEGVNIYMTHGQRERVKSGLELLCRRAVEKGACLALFGHTHRALLVEHEGITLLNPGSASGHSGTASYGLITLEDGKISAKILPIPTIESL